MRRLSPLLMLFACALPAPAAAAAPGLGSWNKAQQREVAAAGVLPRLGDGRFHGARALTGRDLTHAFERLGGRGILVAEGPVTVEAFHRTLLRHLGLGDVATAVRKEAERAGLNPPFRFGSEVVARHLGLRYNHPFPHGEALELGPNDAITRAEAAYSLSIVRHWSGWEVPAARQAFASLALPRYGEAQERALRIAVAKIGNPYVWGGESDSGADCSGYVHQVFGLPRATADAYARAIPRRQRLDYDELEPGDLMFFDRPTGHVAIVLGGGWLINSSTQGVHLQRMDLRGERFTWGRRLL